jgi:hypothetical protein
LGKTTRGDKQLSYRQMGWGRPTAGPIRANAQRVLDRGIAARDDVVHRLLGRLVAGQHLLVFLVHDVPDLRQVGEAHALGVLRRRLAHHLLDRDLAGRLLLVEAVRLGLLIGSQRHRQVAGHLMQAGLDIGLRQEVEESRDALVFLIRLAAEHPERRAAGNRVLRLGIVGQHARAVVHARLHDVAEAAGRFGEEAAFAGEEDLLGFRGTAAIFEGAVLGEVGERLEMLHEGLGIDLQLDVERGDAVLVGAPLVVVPGSEVLGVNPGQPGRGEAAGRGAARFDLLRRIPDFVPGLGRIFRIEAGLLEDVLVEIEDRRGRIVGERQHGAVRLGIIGDDAGQVLALVERLAAHGEHFGNGLHGALGRHHRAGAGIEDLHDVRRLSGAESGDAGIQRFRIGSLEHRNDLVVALALVEFLRKLLDDLVVRAGHRVPPGNLGDGKGGTCGKQRGKSGEAGRETGNSHWFAPCSLAKKGRRTRGRRVLLLTAPSIIVAMRQLHNPFVTVS